MFNKLDLGWRSNKRGRWQTSLRSRCTYVLDVRHHGNRYNTQSYMYVTLCSTWPLRMLKALDVAKPIKEGYEWFSFGPHVHIHLAPMDEPDVFQVIVVVRNIRYLYKLENSNSNHLDLFFRKMTCII